MVHGNRVINISQKRRYHTTSIPPTTRIFLPSTANLSETSTSDTDLPSFQDNAQAMGLMMMEVLKQFVLLKSLACLLLVAKSLLHLVTRKRSGQCCSNSTCPSCCSRRYGVLQSFALIALGPIGDLLAFVLIQLLQQKIRSLAVSLLRKYLTLLA